MNPAYIERLGLHDAHFTRIDHEETMIAEVYRVERKEKPPRVLKVCAREEHFNREQYFLTLLNGTLPIPRLIDLVKPEPGVHGALLMECLPGALLQESDWTDALAHTVGETLARVHLHRTSGYGDLTNPKTLTPNPKRYFEEKVREELAECRAHLPSKLIDQCQHYYDAHFHLLASVDGPCIVHRDFRPGNIMIHQGKLSGIIDWAGGRSGFAEQDFVAMEHRNWPSQPSHKQSLLTGYQTIRPLPDYPPLMPLLRLARTLAVVGYTVTHNTWQTDDAHIYTFNRHFLDTFNFNRT